MPPFRGWVDLPSDLLCRIGDTTDDLQCYTSARGACTAWRCALAPLSPSLLAVYASSGRRLTTTLTAASLPTQRSIDLKALPSGARCMGSSNGWLALSVGGDRQGMFSFSLLHPITGAQIPLPHLTHGSQWVSKIVFAPSPTADDFSAAAICDADRLAYVTAGAKRWAVLDPVDDLVSGVHLVDVVYHEMGKVYCLTQFGDVYVLRLPERHRREPAKPEDPVDPSSAPSYTGRGPGAALRFRMWWDQQQHDVLSRISSGPDLNASATVEPLSPDVWFDPATEFAPPYNKLYAFITAKNLVFCQGNLYQIWRNATCPITFQLPGGDGYRCIAENEVFVLRYYPRRQPCWVAVTDLGGYSVFVGRNNAVSMYADGVPGLMGNCVYWIGGLRDQAMVFNMANRTTSTHCFPGGHAPDNTICWYFLSDMVNKCNNCDGGKRVYRTRARARAEREQDIEE